MTTAIAPVPQTLTLQFQHTVTLPPFPLGITVQVRDEGGIQGELVGLKLLHGGWHYLVQSGPIETWAPEDQVFPLELGYPVLHRGYVIEAVGRLDCRGVDRYTYRVRPVDSPDYTNSTFITETPAEALMEGKRRIDRVLLAG